MISEIFVTFEAVGKDPQVVAVCLEEPWGVIVNRGRENAGASINHNLFNLAFCSRSCLLRRKAGEMFASIKVIGLDFSS